MSHRTPMAIASKPPQKVNHFKNSCLFVTADRKATSPRMKANIIMVRIVPEAKAVI